MGQEERMWKKWGGKMRCELKVIIFGTKKSFSIMWRCGRPVPLLNMGCKSSGLFHLFLWGWVHWDLYKNYFKILFFILDHRCFMYTKEVLKGVSCRCRGKSWATSRAKPAWAHYISIEVLHPLLEAWIWTFLTAEQKLYGWHLFLLWDLPALYSACFLPLLLISGPARNQC